MPFWKINGNKFLIYMYLSWSFKSNDGLSSVLTADLMQCGTCSWSIRLLANWYLDFKSTPFPNARNFFGKNSSKIKHPVTCISRINRLVCKILEKLDFFFSSWPDLRLFSFSILDKVVLLFAINASKCSVSCNKDNAS